MAGLHTSLRPPPPSSAARHHSFVAKLLILLTVLPLSLAVFAFILQGRVGVVDDTLSEWSPGESDKLPGMDSSPPTSVGHSSSDCSTLLPHSTATSFQHFKDGNFKFDVDLQPKTCITTSTSGSLDQILPWMFYHKVLGVSIFFLFVEGEAASPAVANVLESIPGVKVIHRTKELEEEQAKSRIWKENWLSGFFYKPCNYELFVKQTLNMEMAIVMAREVGAEWILHLDTDELMHPAGAREYSLRQLLSDVPDNVDMVVFPNYESSVERDDIKDPFTEVSMFKKNYGHLPKDTYFSMYKESARGNPNYFLTYGNGKSIARVQDHLRPNGAHRWHSYGETPIEITMEEAAVLHYTYAKFTDLTSRRDRCGCKPTKKDVERCFMLEFDVDAFIIASTATEEEMRTWYHEHVVWADTTLNLKLLKKGIMTRIYAPMIIIQDLRESGVFAQIVASVESSNSSRAADSLSLTSRNMGRRKTLETEDTSSTLHDPAIPPESPPVMKYYREIEECRDPPSVEQDPLPIVVSEHGIPDGDDNSLL